MNVYTLAFELKCSISKVLSMSVSEFRYWLAFLKINYDSDRG